MVTPPGGWVLRIEFVVFHREVCERQDKIHNHSVWRSDRRFYFENLSHSPPGVLRLDWRELLFGEAGRRIMPHG